MIRKWIVLVACALAGLVSACEDSGRIRQLEQQMAQLTKERDALQKQLGGGHAGDAAVAKSPEQVAQEQADLEARRVAERDERQRKCVELAVQRKAKLEQAIQPPKALANPPKHDLLKFFGAVTQVELGMGEGCIDVDDQPATIGVPATLPVMASLVLWKLRNNFEDPFHFVYASPGDDELAYGFWDRRPELRKAWLVILETPGAVKLFGEWGIKALPALASEGALLAADLQYVRDLVRKTYFATGTPMADLAKEFDCDTATDSCRSWDAVQAAPIAAFLYRRHRAVGGGQVGDQLIAEYRALALKAGEALQMPEAATWTLAVPEAIPTAQK